MLPAVPPGMSNEGCSDSTPLFRQWQRWKGRKDELFSAISPFLFVKGNWAVLPASVSSRPHLRSLALITSASPSRLPVTFPHPDFSCTMLRMIKLASLSLHLRRWLNFPHGQPRFQCEHSASLYARGTALHYSWGSQKQLVPESCALNAKLTKTKRGNKAVGNVSFSWGFLRWARFQAFQ